ncbi:hypothetical protein GCM10020367_40610 [Streptomyces sannanensis]|uniref:TadE-like domain-containing protein n=1 Tax=Streptomyces sannanensis TaxID=285536 RepID=A0ABP6SEV8_9ACTN
MGRPASARPAREAGHSGEPADARQHLAWRGDRRDRGSAILEFTGLLPILLVVGMAGIQLGIAGYAASQAGTAARAAARAESLEPGTGAAAGSSAVSGWVARRADIATTGCGGGGGTVTATVTVTIPPVIPVFRSVGSVSRDVTMPCDED